VPGRTSVLAGATTPEQVRQNAATADAWRPTEDEIAQIAEIFA
jgi:aryl-alcohol dehydrogenase-like predicted oxidoreductase